MLHSSPPAARAALPRAPTCALARPPAHPTPPPPPRCSWPNAFLDVKAAALGFALVKTGGAVGGFAGPFVVGAMADALHGYTGAMLLLAGVAAGAAGLVAGECGGAACATDACADARVCIRCPSSIDRGILFPCPACSF